MIISIKDRALKTMDDEVCKVSATVIDQHLACENGGDY